jgi:hypothetical protein
MTKICLGRSSFVLRPVYVGKRVNQIMNHSPTSLSIISQEATGKGIRKVSLGRAPVCILASYGVSAIRNRVFLKNPVSEILLKHVLNGQFDREGVSNADQSDIGFLRPWEGPISLNDHRSWSSGLVCCPRRGASNTWRTLRARAILLKGFCKKAAPGLSLS